jgi:hypothetical protein
MISARDSPVREDVRHAVLKYGEEGIDWHKRWLETPDGAEYPPVAPIV